MASGNNADGVALVTGAAGGMGSATVRALVDAGWTEFVLCDIDPAKLEAVASPLRAAGVRVDIVAGNVADLAFPGAVVDGLRERPVSAFVHTAGISPRMADPLTILEVNLAATVRLVNAVREHMANGSAAVLVASNSAYFPLPPEAKEAFSKPLPPEGVAALVHYTPDGIAAYPLSKFGVMALVSREAKAFGQRGARIVSISPGATDTAMVAAERTESVKLDAMIANQAIPRMAQPEEMASLAVFLCSPGASYVTATDILVDGGMINAAGC